MTRRRLLSIAAFASVALRAFPQGKGKGKNNHRGNQDSGVSVAIDIFIGDDQRIVREWIESRPAESLPPGLAKRGSLPPGLEKQLAKNGRLPRGLQKRLTPFPDELEARLSPLKSGLARVFIYGRAVILNRDTRAVLDIFLP